LRSIPTDIRNVEPKIMLRMNIPEGSIEKRARETKPIALAKNTMNRPMVERVDDFMWLFFI